MFDPDNRLPIFGVKRVPESEETELPLSSDPPETEGTEQE